MSPTDKGGNTPESPETPDEPGDLTPDEPTSVDPASDETTPVEPPAVQLSKATPAEPADETLADETPADEAPEAEAPSDTVPVPAEPLGGDYPAPEDFASASAAKKSNKKVLTIIGAVAVLIIAGVAALLAVLFTGDDPVDPDAQIRAVSEEFVAAANQGTGASVEGLLCKKTIDEMGGTIPDAAPAEPQLEISQFDEITINGDTAIAKFTLAAKDQPDAGSMPTGLNFVNEDGWKVCN